MGDRTPDMGGEGPGGGDGRGRFGLIQGRKAHGGMVRGAARVRGVHDLCPVPPFPNVAAAAAA